MKIHDDARSGNIAGITVEIASGVAIDCLERTSGKSALHLVSAMPNANQDMVQFLVQQGATVSAQVFQDAVKTGSVDTIEFLLKSGARIDARVKGGCGTLIYAAYGRGYAGNATLIPVLTLLIEHGADVKIMSEYSESALRILSNHGRLDAVQFLLDHGADATTLAWTDLIRVVALGTVEEFESLLEQGANLGERDYWERTPWLMSLLVGDLTKARRLLSAGSQISEVGRCGKTPVMFAVEGNHVQVLEWLLTVGVDVDATNDFGETALLTATKLGRVDCVSLLLNAGADPGKGTSYGERPIKAACDFHILGLLIAAGDDLSNISNDMRQMLTGIVPGDLRVTQEQYRKGKHRKFGRSNPQRMDNPFWNAMVHCGCNAYQARSTYNNITYREDPVWSYDRFGRTTTVLLDGRIVEIAGEHEDSYDPDFCIYNDVTVFDGKGNIEIWGYPEQVFPPTDFHSATLVDDYIYVVGSIGYRERLRHEVARSIVMRQLR